MFIQNHKIIYLKTDQSSIDRIVPIKQRFLIYSLILYIHTKLINFSKYKNPEIIIFLNIFHIAFSNHDYNENNLNIK